MTGNNMNIGRGQQPRQWVDQRLPRRVGRGLDDDVAVVGLRSGEARSAYEVHR
jgi:hypothetical protein